MSEELDELFLAAREIPDSAERLAFLERSCPNDQELRRSVEQMLADEDRAEAFFAEGGAENWVGFRHSKGSSCRNEVAERVGQILGRYKIKEKLGEGGCGVVYVADQMEPVRRQVALKVLKLGMDTRQVVARFEAERQALAMMDHPNIAKVYDGGATEAGRPYFVMELVRGVKITEFCDQNSLSTEARLRLFIEICHAVQHAHQKGIIHRDIKPSNILITSRDGAPVPKVIDFGIAKATEGRLTDATVHTQLHQFMGTPAYMSPEQIELGGIDIDTRSDIYSLGVLLYELLTGRTPFDTKDLLAQGMDALRRKILETDPLRPSTKLGTLKQDEITITAERRSADRIRLLHQIKGDLDWIVMKCLEKDRARRYETANGLAMDLQRHLSCEPVCARPPSKLYEFRKTVWRHKVGFAATAAIILILAGGVLISTWQAKIARAATASALEAKREASTNAEAERAARKEAEVVTEFLKQVFRSPSPGRDGRTITVVEMLNQASETLDRDLSSQPALRARLQSTLGATYEALGLFQEAIPLEEKALDYYESVAGIENVDTYETSIRLSACYLNAGRPKDALILCEKLLPFLRRTVGAEHPLTAGFMRQLGSAYQATGRPEEALNLFQEAQEVFTRLSGPAHSSTLGAMIPLAACYEELGRWDEAQELRERVLHLSRDVDAENRQSQAVIPPTITPNSDTAKRETAISPKEWNELSGRTVVVSAMPIIPTATGIVLEEGDRYRLYPNPADTWNTAPNRWKDADYRGHIGQLERTSAGKPYMQLCSRIGKSSLQPVQMGATVTGVGALCLMPSDFEGGGVAANNTGSIRVKIVKAD